MKFTTRFIVTIMITALLISPYMINAKENMLIGDITEIKISVLYENFALVNYLIAMNDIYAYVPIIGNFISLSNYEDSAQEILMILFNPEENIIELLTLTYPVNLNITYLTYLNTLKQGYYLINLTLPIQTNITVSLPEGYMIINVEPIPERLKYVEGKELMIKFKNASKIFIEYLVLTELTDLGNEVSSPKKTVNFTKNFTTTTKPGDLTEYQTENLVETETPITPVNTAISPTLTPVKTENMEKMKPIEIYDTKIIIIVIALIILLIALIVLKIKYS